MACQNNDDKCGEKEILMINYPRDSSDKARVEDVMMIGENKVFDDVYTGSDGVEDVGEQTQYLMMTALSKVIFSLPKFF